MSQERPDTTSRAKWVLAGFLVIAGYFAALEHRAHLSGLLQYLPLVLLLACPFMHIFMHGHHGHGHRDNPSAPRDREQS